MGNTPVAGAAKQVGVRDELVRRFAQIMWDKYHARTYLFGSRARGAAHEKSDYDLVAISSEFEDQNRFRRCLDRFTIWYAAGGFRQSLDLHCYTPQEFKAELNGLGYLAHARARGELLRVPHSRATRLNKETEKAAS